MQAGKFDLAIIGAGCIGTSTAKHLSEAGHRVVVLEKESAPAMHQSGRNSGVIHAGYNLAPGSNKARFCVEGSRQMRAYCLDRGVAMVQGGILVVAQNEAETKRLEALHARGKTNEVEVAMLDADELRTIEPHAKGIAALHAPEGASVDSEAYVRALVSDAEAAGATFRYNVAAHAVTEQGIETLNGLVPARAVVNAAGLYADKLAGDLAHDVRIVPFRGYYARLPASAAGLVRSHIYAAPDPAFPFLGVHLSRRVDGTVAVGPGAMLAFGREAYKFWNIQPKELAGTLTWPGFWKLFGNPGFRRLLPQEVRKSLSLGAIEREARRLVPELPRGLRPFRAGNRAQMIDRDGHLVDDIVVRETDTAVHVLNAVSPGLTCSLPFGAHLARRAETKL